MKRYLILLLLLITTQGYCFDLWQGAGLFGGSIAGLPGASQQTAYLPFDSSLGTAQFVRNGNAYNPDTGLIAPHNYLTYSSDLTNAVWGADAGTGLTPNDAVAPDGTLTAMKVVFAAANKEFKRDVTITHPSKYTIYIKGTAGETILPGINGESDGLLTLTGGWDRFTGTTTATRTKILLASTWSGATARTIWVWGPQANNYSTVTTYVPTTTAAVYGPRYVTGKDGIAAHALLVEESSTNLCLQSQAAGTTWTQTGVTIASNSIAAPDGNTTADTLTATQDNATWVQTPTATTNIPKTWSLYIKRKTGTGAISMSLDGGSTYTAKTITTEWARYSITQTLAAHSLVLKISTNTDSVYIWQSDLVELPYTLSPVPTTTAAVTRAAEYATQATSGVITAAQGTVMAWGYVDTAVQSSTSVNHLLSHGTSATANIIRIWKNGANTWGMHVSDAAGTTTGADVAQTLTTGYHDMAISWSAAGTFGYIDGVQVVADATGVTIPASLATNLYIGSRMDGTLQYSSKIDQVRIFNRALTAAEILTYYQRGK